MHRAHRGALSGKRGWRFAPPTGAGAGRGQAVETPVGVHCLSSDFHLCLLGFKWGWVEKLVEVGPGTLGLTQVQALGDLADRKGGLLPRMVQVLCSQAMPTTRLAWGVSRTK